MGLKEELEKQFGKGIVQFVGQEGNNSTIKVVPTFIEPLDKVVLGCGGIPTGRHLEFFGEEGGGKTTLALSIIAAYQSQGHTGVFIDVEHALNPDWAKQLGVDLNKMMISQPDNGEQVIEIILAILNSKETSGIIVVDSVAAMLPKSELEGDVGDANMGVHARLMSQACRKITPALSNSQWSIFWINQVRDKLGIVYGSPIATPGGRALKFYTSIRGQVSRGPAIKTGTDIVGHSIKVKVIKNKFAPPFKECEIPLYYEGGLDSLGMKIDAMIKSGEVEQKGAWYYWGEKKFKGREALVEAVKNNE